MGRNKYALSLVTVIIAYTMGGNVALGKAPDYVSVDSLVRMGAIENDSGDAEAGVEDAELGIGINITEFIKANFRAEFSQDIDKWEDLLEEAYFVIDVDKSGAPVIHAIFDSVKLGQSEQSSGQNKRMVPMYKQHMMYAIETDERVTGATFILSNDLIEKLIDTVEVSAYKSGDGSLLSLDGNSIWVTKVKKNLQDLLWQGSSLELQASMKQGSSSSEDDRQYAVSADYYFARWNVYAQVIAFDSDGSAESANYATNGGLAFEVSDSIAIGGDVAYTDYEESSAGERTDYTAFLKLKPKAGIEIGLSYTRRDRENGGNENVPGIMTSLSHSYEGAGELYKVRKD